MDNRQADYQPLAERLRPKVWSDFVGAEQLPAVLLANFADPDLIPPSVIFWGDPGSGKTTLARLIKSTKTLPFVDFSAVSGTVAELRKIIAAAKAAPAKPTIVFTDEIHRFTKLQQDSFLPAVEAGDIVLIAATTENPSFYLNNALLSRTQVVRISSLTKDQLREVLAKAALITGLEFSPEVSAALCKQAGQDARVLLNIIEQLDQRPERSVDLNDLQASNGAFYDRSGEEHYNQISAFIKSLRGSSSDGALYWGFRMLESGEDPRFILRRMIIFASEDIGNADPRALSLMIDASNAFEKIGFPEAKIILSQAITYLATAPKSNRSYQALGMTQQAIRQSAKAAVPMHLRNAPTKLMKKSGYGAGYQYPHDYDGAFLSDVEYLPETVEGNFYQPSDRGYEKTIGARLAWLKKLGQSKKG